MKAPRFIAGAVCPACGEVDRVVVETVAGEEQMRCVSCGVTRLRSTGGARPSGSALPEGRLGSRRDRDDRDAVQRVRLPGADGRDESN